MAGTVGRWRMALRILCAVALIAVGFAHQPLAAPIPPSVSAAAALAAYTLPDGSRPELCLPAENGGGNGKFHVQHGCEACVIGASILLPVPADIAGRNMRVAKAAPAILRTEAVYRALFPPNKGPRAPPSSLRTA